MTWPESPLWRHAVRLYGRDGVAAACLRLQDGHGADVPLVLLALWLATRGVALDAVSAAGLLARAVQWRAIREGLRTARRSLKPLAAGSGAAGERRRGLRERIKTAELDAEHELLLELELLAADLPRSRPPSAALARDNLQQLGQDVAGRHADGRALLAAAFPGHELA